MFIVATTKTMSDGKFAPSVKIDVNGNVTERVSRRTFSNEDDAYRESNMLTRFIKESIDLTLKANNFQSEALS